MDEAEIPEEVKANLVIKPEEEETTAAAKAQRRLALKNKI